MVAYGAVRFCSGSKRTLARRSTVPSRRDMCSRRSATSRCRFQRKAMMATAATAVVMASGLTTLLQSLRGAAFRCAIYHAGSRRRRPAGPSRRSPVPGPRSPVPGPGLYPWRTVTGVRVSSLAIEGGSRAMEFDYVIVGGRLRRLRARPPSVGGPARSGGPPRGRRTRQEHLDPHPGRFCEDPERSDRELALPYRAGRKDPESAHPDPARQGPGWIELHQWNALRSRPRPRLRHVGPARKPGLVLRRRAPLLQAFGEPRGARERVSRGRRSPQRLRAGPDPSPLRRIHRRGGILRLPSQSGR